jgi:hypothetical protein
MTDLSKVLPTKSATVQQIENYWKQRGSSETPRGYLGASAIGKECARALWYEFRKCSKPDFDGRLYRLFNRGHREEETFCEELRGIGCEVHEFDNDGNQFEVIACDGHFKGHTDGAALGVPEAPKTWHLLEMKTASAKSFAKTEKDGVEKDKPQHFAQMQVYMHLTGLKRALYMVVNKDTDALYTERLRYDSKKAQSYIDKAQMIINATTPPERGGELQEKPKFPFSPCTYCDAKNLCHGLGDVAVPVPEVHCRNCTHSTPVSDGKWQCDHHEKEATAVCNEHLFIPALINFAEPTDSFANKDGSTVIEFTSEDGTVWHHGSDREAGQFSSHDLMTLPRDLVELPNAKKKETLHNLEARYSVAMDGVESVWRGNVDDVRGEFESRYRVPMSNPDATQEGDGWTAAEFRPHGCVIVYGNTAEIRQDNNK